MSEPAASRNRSPALFLWEHCVKACASIKNAIVIWLIFVSFVVFVTYVLLRIHVTYELQRDLALIKGRQDNVIRVGEAFIRDTNARLNALERTLYGEVQPMQERLVEQKIPARTSQIEISQQNTNKEFRQRLERLERDRLGRSQIDR